MTPKYVRLSTDLISSSERFENSSDLFPSRDRLLGVSARIGYHPDYKRVVVEISEDRPSFVTTNRGEYCDIEESGEKYKLACLELASYAEKVARELMEHSNRLRQEANRQVSMLDVDRLRSLESTLDNSYTIPDESRTPVHAKSKSHTKYTPSPVKVVDLSLFDD